MNKISITICGDGGCGKSSITLRLVRSQWVHEYDPTIEDSYSVTRTVDGRSHILAITDTAGQQEYRGLWTASTLESDAFLLVYDLTNPASLGTLDHFLELIHAEAAQRLENNERARQAHSVLPGRPPPVVLIVGNKCDLKESRAVTARDGLAYARQHGCGFMETSAREMVNIEETFTHLIRRVVDARVYRPAPSPPTVLSAATVDVVPESRRHRAWSLIGQKMGRGQTSQTRQKCHGCACSPCLPCRRWSMGCR